MQLLLRYLVVYLLHLQGAAALPQGITPSGVSSVTSATPAATSVVENDGSCDFSTMNDFIDYVNKNHHGGPELPESVPDHIRGGKS
jgi:hypothetical protein